jgi:gas vesicle protein
MKFLFGFITGLLAALAAAVLARPKGLKDMP